MIGKPVDLARSNREPIAGFWLLLIAIALTPFPAHAAKVSAHTGEITLPTYGWAAVKHPYFRGTDGRNIYPYPMLDFLSRDKTTRTYRTVVLENEYLRITFLPELGGKIHEVLDKTTGQPMFYVNHVIKPGLIGQCGAWTSGGVEWNTGPQGHTVSCMVPVDVVILPPEKDGARSVAIGETERIYRTKWTVVVTLRPGRSFIEERIRIYNPTETVRPYYFWNCTAVPNTPGFRFIYPMTLGCDHAGEKFFTWPIDNGKDLSRGTNYQDASSIFAWHCDQDFFGAYLEDRDRGIVACANHHQLPGKKAWTWGHGSYGAMHQKDLTDDDGPYNEVQTGPLLTQAQVGRLDPCEAVEWKEWWYPIHGLGGFTFANPNLAANASLADGKLTLRLLGSASWRRARLTVRRGQESLGEVCCDISPAKPCEIALPLRGAVPPFLIGITTADGVVLAEWREPLALPPRTPPEKKRPAQSATELTQAAWQEFLFARFAQATALFEAALKHDPACRDAHLGLAHLHLDRDPARAAAAARAALAVDPEHGPAHFVLAVAEARLDQPERALHSAWQATFAPSTAVSARALVAKLLLRRRDAEAVIAALTAPGPWQTDPLCRNRLALALLERGQARQAQRLAAENTQTDPLDAFARSVAWLALPARQRQTRAGPAGDNLRELLELVGQYSDLGRPEMVHLLLAEGYVGRTERTAGRAAGAAMADYWWADVSVPRQSGREGLAKKFGGSSSATGFSAQGAGDWPYQYEALPVLQRAVEREATNGQAALLLGHLLFHLGRHAEGRAMWQRAAALGAEPVIAYRALGMAAKTLDNDLPSARDWLTKANQADPKDSIVARDLANVLFALADKADSEAEKRALATEARDRLQAAFAAGKGRSDFVALLARAHNRLGEFADTARLLDRVRVTIWEGAREVHDLFEQAHLALGEAHLRAGRAAEALAEFDRALEYPENLATGRLESAREAHIHYLRGNALAALGRKPEALAAWQRAADEPASNDAQIEAARQQAREALGRAAVE